MKLLPNRKHDFFRTPQRAIQLRGDPTRMNDRTGHEFAQVQETKKMVMHLLTTAMTLPWVEDLQSTLLSHDHSVQLINREKPMHVGGVGKGCQTCTQDVVFPLALQRSDGTMNLGDFTPATAGCRHC